MIGAVLLAVVLASHNAAYEPPRHGLCLDSAVNVGYLYEMSNAKRVVKIDKIMATDRYFFNYVIGYLAITHDGSQYLNARKPEWLAPNMYPVLSRIAGLRLNKANAARLQIPIRGDVSKIRGIKLQTCITWPANAPFPSLTGN